MQGMLYTPNMPKGRCRPVATYAPHGLTRRESNHPVQHEPPCAALTLYSSRALLKFFPHIVSLQAFLRIHLPNYPLDARFPKRSYNDPRVDSLKDESRLHQIRRCSCVRRGLQYPPKLGDEAAIARFGELWSSKLAAEVERAPEITREQAEELLEGKLKTYATAGYIYRQSCSITCHLLPGSRVVDIVTSFGHSDHRDNTRLCVNFETIADRQRLRKLRANCVFSRRCLGFDCSLTSWTSSILPADRS